METRVAVMGIIVECTDSVEQLNAILHDFGNYIIGRMGIPYREKKVNIISIAMDAPQDTISSLSGKIGKLEGVSVKTAYSNLITPQQPNSPNPIRQTSKVPVIFDGHGWMDGVQQNR